MVKWVGKKRAGVALLLTVGILALLSIIGISFAITMLLTRKEAGNFANSVKARYIAEAGINRAIMDIRAQIASVSYTNLKAYVSGYVAASGTNIPFGEGTYTLAVTSEEDKVNLNTFDPEPAINPDGTPNSQIAILRTFPLTDQQIANIIDYRDSDSVNSTIGSSTGNIEGTAQCKNQPFDSIEEIRVATGITKAVFDSNKDKITLFKPIIRGGLLGKYYRNIIGSSPSVVIDTSAASFGKKVVELGPLRPSLDKNMLPGVDGPAEGWSEINYASFAGGSALIVTPGDSPLNRFGIIWNGYIDIRQNEVNVPITFSVNSQGGTKLFIDETSILPAESWQDAGGNYSGGYTFQMAGWHRIRLEYYKNLYNPAVSLRWDAGGSTVTIPAERLGYDPPTEAAGGYNHAGMYAITATASVIKNGQITAIKQVTAVAEIFGVWTQTTKEEFYAAWYNRQGDFSDGEVFNVNWLDSCPTDQDYWDAAASKMNWESNYTKTTDSVKLGYWDNFDEDIPYSAVMMKGYVWNRSWWGDFAADWRTLDALNISYRDFQDNDGDGDRELYLYTDTFTSDHFEANRNYFRPNTEAVFVRVYVKEPAPSSRIAWRGGGTLYPAPPAPPQWPLYVGSTRWIYYYDINGDDKRNADPPESDNYTEPEVFPVYDAAGNPKYIYNPTSRNSGDLENIPAPGTYDYYQPEATFCGCWIYAKARQDEDIGWSPLTPSDSPTFLPIGFKAYVTDGHGTLPVGMGIEPRPLYPFGDTSEVKLNNSPPNPPFYVQFDYITDKALAMIGRDNGTNSVSYRGWVNGSQKANGTWMPNTYPYPSGANSIFKFVANNQYFGWDWVDFYRGQCVIGPSDFPKNGAVTKMQTHWDDIRCIPENGYLVSAPFYAGPTVRWGTISWGGQTPRNTGINIYTRKTSTSFPATDSAWTAAPSNGASIGGTDTRIQYKAVLSTNQIDRTQYSTSSQTPVLEDVTATYLPAIQIKYWREGS